jgi:ATP-dependent Zn protease
MNNKYIINQLVATFLKDYLPKNLNDPFLLPIIVSSFFSLFAIIIPYSKSIFSYIYSKLKAKLCKKDIKGKLTQVKLITSNNDLNELYPAIMWYITSNNTINQKELDYELYFDQSLKSRQFITNYLSKDIKPIISKIPNLKNTCNIKYKNYDLKYYITKEKIKYQDTDKDNIIINILDTNNIIDEFTKHCIDKYIKYQNNDINKQIVHRIGNNIWNKSYITNYKTFKNICLKNKLEQTIFNVVNEFKNSENWYKELDLPYTLGFLLYGPPGTGKTSIIKAIANVFEKDIWYFDLSKIKNSSEFEFLISKINYDTSLIVFEDIDTMNDIIYSRDISKDKIMVEDIKDISKDIKDIDKLTLGQILDFLDGLQENHGRIVIMTSNHPEKLDRALIRPGRIDYHFELSYCDENMVKQIYYNFFKEDIPEELLEKLGCNKYTPAIISNLFKVYKMKKTEILDNLPIFFSNYY